MVKTPSRTRPGPAYRRSPEKKRESLLAAARTLFAEQGYDDTSTAQIAARAGVSEGILFHHFGSKRGLLAELAEQHAKDAVRATMPEDPTMATEEFVVRSAFDFADRNPGLHQVFEEAGQKLDDFDITRQRDIVIGVIEDNLKQGMTEGLVRQGDARIMAELHFAVVDGAYQAWRKTGDRTRREAYIAEAIRAMKAMLAPVDDPAPSKKNTI